MKGNLKSFFAGVLTTVAVIGLIGTAGATVAKRTATLDYNNIKVTLDGKQVDLVDANGNSAEPFAISGTTYLPLRPIANALGLDVAWDSSTNTAVLTTPVDSEMPSGTTILDQKGIKITFLGFEEQYDYLKGYKIKLQIENNTNTNYTVQVRDLSVNGIMAESIFSCDVAAGKTANDYIWLYDLEESGITGPIQEAEFTFHVFDSDAWDTYFDSGVITVK